LVKREDLLLDFNENNKTTSLFSPLYVHILLLLIVIFITFKDVKNNRRTRSIDFTLLFTTGLIGLILTYLWLFSSHSTAPKNFNILWAFLPNLCIAFFMLKKSTKKWLKKYILLLLILLSVIPVLWFAGTQIFPIAAVPLLLLLFTRYLFLFKCLLTSRE
jgi:hypothetical protein